MNLEARYFNDFLIPKSTSLGIKCIAMHDGYCTNSLEAGNALKHFLDQEFLTNFSFAPTIRVKNGEFCEVG
jgi:hypothetical protein